MPLFFISGDACVTNVTMLFIFSGDDCFAPLFSCPITAYTLFDHASDTTPRVFTSDDV